MDKTELRAELKRRGWRQADLARRLGVSAVTVNRWAQDKQPIPPTVAAYLRDVELESEGQGQGMTGDELRADLKRRGWTQTALAKRLGVGVSAVNRWCQGTRPVPNTMAAYLRDVPRAPEVAGKQAAQVPVTDMQAEIVALTERLRAAEREVAWLRSQLEAAQRNS